MSLGSTSLQHPIQKAITVTPDTCNNLSLFKDILNEYRRLDDSIYMRLNRSNAFARDQQPRSAQDQQQEACANIWKDLVENWKRRSTIINYCVEVVDQESVWKQQKLSDNKDDPRTQRRIKAELYSDQVKRNQMHNQLTVDKITQRRSLDALRSRCKHFVPPLTDAEARRWWDAASTT